MQVMPQYSAIVAGGGTQADVVRFTAMTASDACASYYFAGTFLQARKTQQGRDTGAFASARLTSSHRHPRLKIQKRGRIRPVVTQGLQETRRFSRTLSPSASSGGFA